MPRNRGGHSRERRQREQLLDIPTSGVPVGGNTLLGEGNPLRGLRGGDFLGGVPAGGAYYGRSVGWQPAYQNRVRGGRNFRGNAGIFGAGGISAVNMHFLTAALKNIEPRIDDDFIDRINYYYSPSVIIIFAILVSAKQYVGHPIECWVPAQFTKAMEQYTENYCWIQNTYWVPFQDLIPMKYEDRERKQIGYYQWVPFILAIQALLFYLPCLVWRMLSGQSGINVHGILQMACDEHNIEPENRSRSIDILSRHIDDALQHQRDFGSKNKSIYLWACVRIGKLYGAYVSVLYVIVKILYVGNVFGQFFLLNRFLETAEYPFFGAHILWDLLNGIEWENSGKFPRVTLCDFEIRVLGNIHRHTVQCVLVINMFTEKIFVFLWLWFLLLFLVNVFSLLYWLLTLSFTAMRSGFIRKHLELTDTPPESDKMLRRFVSQFLRPDGVFVIRMLASHAGTVMCNEIVYALWLRFRGLRCGAEKALTSHQPTRSTSGSQQSIPSISLKLVPKYDISTNTEGPLYRQQPVPCCIPSTPLLHYDEFGPHPLLIRHPSLVNPGGGPNYPYTPITISTTTIATTIPSVSKHESNHKFHSSNPISQLLKRSPSKLLTSKLPSRSKDKTKKGEVGEEETESFILNPHQANTSPDYTNS